MLDKMCGCCYYKQYSICVNGWWIMLLGKNGDDFLSDLSDEQLALLCKQNEKAFCILLSRYVSAIRKKAFIMSKNTGTDADDLMQEGIVGFLNAVRTFNSEQNTKFSSYSNICTANKMKTALIKNSRNDIPVDEICEDASQSDDTNPENIFIEKEKLNEIEGIMGSFLSKKELEIFRLFLKGSTYNQMARQLNISQKTVDNALQRVRRKLKSVWRADHFSD